MIFVGIGTAAGFLLWIAYVLRIRYVCAHPLPGFRAQEYRWLIKEGATPAEARRAAWERYPDPAP